MATPRLTIGMATFEDYDGVYFTLQSLRMYHDLRDVELLVVDNNPTGATSKVLKTVVENWMHDKGNAGARYIPMAEPVGTTQSRNRVFKEAKGDAVVCVDSHVLLVPGSVQRLIEWYASNPESEDLISGPLLFDNLSSLATHFNREWRAEMFGTWGSAWQCPCSESGVQFSPVDRNKKCEYVLLAEQTPLTSCGACGRELPKDIAFAGHEQKLDAENYYRLGTSHDDIFEIPAQGLGLFSCRRSAWLGFNENFRGFGGEEIYIHDKFRQHGRQCLSLGFLKWAHRFARPNGVKYPLTKWNKVRNYVLGFNELGLPLDPVKEHFVKPGRMTENEWAYLVENPIERTQLDIDKPNCGAANVENSPYRTASIDELFDAMAKLPRDLDQHLTTLAAYAKKVKRITEFSKRRESLIAFASSGLCQITSYNMEAGDIVCKRVAEIRGDKCKLAALDSPQVASIEETDLLFIDSEHTSKRLTEELNKYAKSVKRFIVLHDTALHGEKGQDGKPGLLSTLRWFMQQNPQWSVVYHTTTQYGLTVLSCDDTDKPKLPSVIEMATNFAQAVATHVATGAKSAPLPMLTARLEVCSLCEQRKDNRCAACGCFLAEKAKMKSSDCPLGKWYPVDKEYR